MDAEHFHAFISYAWADNQPYDSQARPLEPRDPGAPAAAGTSGWVSTFVDRYRKHLGRAIGRMPEGERIWLDYEELRGSDRVQPAIHAKLAAASLLMPILSPAWFASPWCREEFRTFLDRHPDDGLQRLFPVWMEPVERADLDEEEARGIWDQVQEFLKYKLWYRDAKNSVRTRWFPLADPTDRHYGDVQQDLARDMAKRIKALARAAAASGTGTTGADAAAARPGPISGTPGRASQTRSRAAAVLAEKLAYLREQEAIVADPVQRFALKKQIEEARAKLQEAEQAPEQPPPDLADIRRRIPADQLVLLMGGISDADLVREVAERLRERYGIGYLIPLVAQEYRDGCKPSELRQDLRDNLRVCTAVLAVLREGPPKHVHEQLRESLQLAAKRPQQAPCLHLCHCSDAPLTIRPVGMRVHSIDHACDQACADAFIAELAP